MTKNVCMFVWNHFTNDARVLRECTALTEAGYEVDLFAIHNWKIKDLPKKEKHQNGFTVTRVNNRWEALHKILRIAGKLTKKKFEITVLTLLVWNTLLNLGLITSRAGSAVFAGFLAILAIGILIITKTKLPTLLTRSYIFMQMIYHGRKKKYDFYHSNDLNTLMQGAISSKWLRRKKLIYDSHEVQTSRTGYNSSIYGRMEKFLLLFVDEMIAENHTRAKYNEDLYGLYPKVVHNYPVPTTPEESTSVNLHELLDLPPDERILLYQGGVQMGRGLEQLVDAVPLIDSGTVVFIGDGKIKASLMKKVKEMDLEHRVKFLPKVPVDELLHYTKNAYLGFQVLNNVCFNHYSASSNKLFEYMMSGVPVVACSFPEIQKVVDTERIGVCVDSHDPKAIAKGVNYLLKHPEKRAEMSRNCLMARQKYNWKQEKEIFIEIYQTA
ncbi:glycosyltransferase [Peribacillus sp. SI8-4]|uniref:glycosyltransferase n=1 Tax=Peribacillus sp. SI8-4 TaxID=3048009 RepID=UPI0025569C14|nr:glycosyltransferase [Peribacillus sp. SI8-4]